MTQLFQFGRFLRSRRRRARSIRSMPVVAALGDAKPTKAAERGAHSTDVGLGDVTGAPSAPFGSEVSYATV